MARYSSGMASTIVGTAVRPCFALLQTATVTGVLRGMKVTNTTDTAAVYELVNITAGTAGASQVERRHRRNSPAASCDPRAGWTADATVGERTGYIFDLSAAKGAGMYETFGESGLEGELGATSALGLVLVTGAPASGPYVAMIWDE
jgi:hypothetical protein